MQKAKVHVLDINTSNQIAAGEVVEKPASVVKELVENALDAGADSIDVTIYEGGTEFIRVTDNGSGMSEADLRLAVRRHATSKILKAEDLMQLHTLGFRGEALPSIASVSEFEIITRPAEQEMASSLKINGGLEQECQPAGGPVGTTVIVKDLFYNVPARRKFLKTVGTEGRYINELLTKMALDRPDVRFRLTSNDKEVLTTPGKGDLKETIMALYGKKVSAELLPVKLADPGLSVSGYIGRPTLLKGTRGWQTLLVNSRIINSRMISKAIEHAYQSQIPKSGFPFAVLYIQVDPRAIDVNVHPQKSEVKFSDEGKIYKAVFKALSDALQQPLQPREDQQEQSLVQDPGAKPPALSDQWLRPQPAAKHTGSKIPAEDSLPLMPRPQIWKQPEPEEQSGQAPDLAARSSYVLGQAPELLPQERTAQGAAAVSLAAETVHPESADASEKTAAAADAVTMQAAGSNGLVTIWPLGQVDKTFIIAQSETSLFLIDQHAAHERILYDKLVLSHKTVPAQQLLMPLYVDAQSQDVDLLVQYQEDFKRLGVEFTPVGEASLRIDCLPVDIKTEDAAGFIQDISQYLRENREPEPSELRPKVLHMAACRAAIKAGEILTLKQMRQLILDLCRTAHPFTCPHGRPCMIEISSAELYKMFKRTGFNLSGKDEYEDD